MATTMAIEDPMNEADERDIQHEIESARECYKYAVGSLDIVLVKLKESDVENEALRECWAESVAYWGGRIKFWSRRLVILQS